MKLRGFSAVELFILIQIIFVLAIAGTCGYVLYHFIGKYW